ncbi:MAG: ABC transporter permease [Clostridia bacterium]|nr:ABC transporter permease [Clostridia bacterium]
MNNPNNMLKKLLKRWELFLVVFLILEIAVFGAANPKFLNPTKLMTSVVNYISVCIISLFVTMVMITGGIDIQAPSIIGLTSIVIGVLWSDAGMNIWVAVLLATLLAALCGALSGFFVAYCGVQPMVVTLGGSFLYSGLALLISSLSATPAYQGISGFPGKNDAGKYIDFRWLGKGDICGIPVQIIIYVLLIALCMWILHRTKYGERLFLIGVNPGAAEYSGINTRMVTMSTYILSAVSAALVGILLTANLNSAKYNVGSGYTMGIITAVVLGGTLNTGGKGSILGTVLASLILCILRYGLPLCFNVSTQNLDLPIGIILVLVILGREIAGQHMLQKWFKRRKTH